MNIAGNKIVVVGLGRSGLAAANLCLDRGARVVGTDVISRAQAAPAILALESRGAFLALGGHDGVPWGNADMVIVSPGVPAFPKLLDVERSGREVVGELDFASRFTSAPIAVVGGTNGKSTVTEWLGQMLSGDRHRVFVGGNLGTPLSEVAGQRFDCIVLEVSSFQAERVPTLHPRTATLLNITEDHLDRYADFHAYSHAKGNVFVRMTADDVAVIPAGDQACRQQALRGNAQIVTFGTTGDVRVEGDSLVDSLRGFRFDARRLRVSGVHNRLNACAAMAMAGALGADLDHVERALEGFDGLPHRMVLVGERSGVRFYDDSKGTNVGASVAALRGLREKKAVLIAGGRDKQGSYGPLMQVLAERGRALVTIGEAAERIGASAPSSIPVVRATTMQSAVQRAFELAHPGDAVLLSPACSSYDMFANYKERGQAFTACVRDLEHEAKTP